MQRLASSLSDLCTKVTFPHEIRTLFISFITPTVNSCNSPVWSLDHVKERFHVIYAEIMLFTYRASKCIGNNQRRGNKIISSCQWVNTAFEISVSRKNSCSNNVCRKQPWRELNQGKKMKTGL